MGVKTVTLVDASRTTGGVPRTLVTEVWYPATEAARGGVGVEYDLLPLLTEEQRQLLAGRQVPRLATTAVRDAPPRMDRAPYPLVVFSHGQGGIRWQSTFYTVALASHGYVVVSPDHAGDTIPDALRDGLNPAASFGYRPDDASFLLDVFLGSAAPNPLPGMSDPDRIGVTGHSFGGFTALRAAARDPRVKAIVPQASASVDLAWIELPSDFTLDIPVMLQAGHADKTLPWDEHVTPTWIRLRRPRYLVDLTTGGHFTFSALCEFELGELAVLVGLPEVQNALEDGCGPTAPAPAVAQAVINHFAIGFFNATLRDSPGSQALLNQQEAEKLGAGVAAITAEP